MLVKDAPEVDVIDESDSGRFEFKMSSYIATALWIAKYGLPYAW